MLYDPTFWVLVAFVAFIGVVGRPAWRLATTALDDRALKIKADLEAAERLRVEAQDLLATYRRKQRDAAKDAASVLAAASEEAERVVRHGEERLERTLARRRQMALDRIARAEAEAIKEVRDQAVEVAVDATRRVLAERLSGETAAALVGAAIRDLPAKLH